MLHSPPPSPPLLQPWSSLSSVAAAATLTLLLLLGTTTGPHACAAWMNPVVTTTLSRQMTAATANERHSPFLSPSPRSLPFSSSSLIVRHVASVSDEVEASTTTTTTALPQQQPPPHSYQPPPAFPELGEDGIYNILNREQHEAFVEAHQDKLIVLKVYAPWCRACKGMQPKFSAVVQDEKYQDLPIVWAQLSVQHNKEFVKTIGVLALPTVQFYVGGSLSDTFPCGPSKIPILKRKLIQLVNDHVDPSTRLVKATSIEQAKLRGNMILLPANDTDATVATDDPDAADKASDSMTATASAPPKNTTTESMPSSWSSPSTTGAPLISLQERIRLRQNVRHLASLNIADFDRVMDEARLVTFEPGSVIVRQGKPGRTFYIIQEGEVEICQKTFAEDPMQMSGWYLGTVVNRLSTGDYFGERSLLTGEPRAASIRAVERTSLYALDRDLFPMSSPLSGHTRFTVNDWMDQVDEKYGVNFAGLYEREVSNQLRQASVASQTRGSIYKPNKIPGVDTEDDIDWDAPTEKVDEGSGTAFTSPNPPPVASVAPVRSPTMSGLPQIKTNNESIFNLLRRFKMIRQVGKCFDYIALTGAQWGEMGSRNRRAMLVNRLSQADREEFSETFDLIDQDRSGEITLLELKRVMESVGDHKTDEELMVLISESVKTTPSAATSTTSLPSLNKQDFMGIMAEAEFYYLFRDIFRSLDPQDSGFVKARDLDRVLSGTRDLISDDHKSIIDMGEDDEDLDMLIDYEQFSRMLLG
ncbi:hypothetical protein ACA910_022098 [Epithemia clementina (nom. ined.)]